MGKERYIIPIFVPHLGCPHNCVFCNQNSITGTTTTVDAAFVENTVQAYLDTIEKKEAVIEISFFGGTFTAIDLEKQKELLRVARKHKQLGRIQYIRLSTRPDYIDREILEHLRHYEVDIIELGVQSLVPEVLEKSGRGHTVQQVEVASRMIKEYGFLLGHQIMLGLPGDSFEKDIYTAKKSITLQPDLCRIYPALVIRNTPMEEMYLKGLYVPYKLEDAIQISEVLYSMYTSKGITVVRIGLQPTEEINEGKEIVAGPFHPAFRELVEGKIYNDMIYESIKNKAEAAVNIYIHSKDLSKLYANGKKIFYDMKAQLKTVKLKVIQDNTLQRGNVRIEEHKENRILSFYEYISTFQKEGYF